MQRLAPMILVLVLMAACKEDKKPVPEPPLTPTTAPAATTPVAPAPEPEPAAIPEPATPEELELALKSAMVEGRDADVIAYCEMSKLEPGKGNPQTALGCTLAACRVADQTKAKVWSKGLPKELRKQATSICMANKVIL